MKFENKGLLEVFIAILSIMVLFLIFYDLYLFAIIVLIIDFAIIFYYFTMMANNKNENTKYNSQLKNILKTYDSILVEVKEIPVINKHSIVVVTNFKDMVDAQYELRKPIYFKKYDNSCGFILMGDKDVCIYIFKMNDLVECPLEKMLTIYNKYGINNVEELFDKFDKTGVIRLSNNRSYRISPVREKKEEVVKPNFINPVNEEEKNKFMESRGIITNNNVSNTGFDLPELKNDGNNDISSR